MRRAPGTQEAVLSSGEVVPFDYVAIASGSSYGDTLCAAGPEAATRQGRLGQLQVGGAVRPFSWYRYEANAGDVLGNAGLLMEAWTGPAVLGRGAPTVTGCTTYDNCRYSLAS